jgi:hypothetical protein
MDTEQLGANAGLWSGYVLGINCKWIAMLQKLLTITFAAFKLKYRQPSKEPVWYKECSNFSFKGFRRLHSQLIINEIRNRDK